MEPDPSVADPDESRLRRWSRRLSILAGLAAVVLGIVLAIQCMQTPAIALEPPISEYAATHSAGPQPVGPRTGLWIEIPALKIALPVREGDGSNNIPDWVALHYPGTAEPGIAGNSYLYAHGLRGMFGTLLFAKKGELVLLHDYTTKQVEAFHISNVVGRIRWNDVSWLRERSSTPLLTMQTCVGADINTDRWIVQAAP
ncbi:MAG: sortase [Candidatus Dormibacteraeota bacterium]|nr:sortase [Candidatus Dormibacteraeota bacterium]MBV9525898.1 sortase [Candidatus Dormibacteraeota bacterium]